MQVRQEDVDAAGSSFAMERPRPRMPVPASITIRLLVRAAPPCTTCSPRSGPSPAPERRGSRDSPTPWLSRWARLLLVLVRGALECPHRLVVEEHEADQLDPGVGAPDRPTGDGRPRRGDSRRRRSRSLGTRRSGRRSRRPPGATRCGRTRAAPPGPSRCAYTGPTVWITQRAGGGRPWWRPPARWEGRPVPLLADTPAFREDRRAARAVDRAVDAAAAQQGLVRRVDDRVDRLLGDVALARSRSSCDVGSVGFCLLHLATVVATIRAVDTIQVRLADEAARTPARGWLLPLVPWVVVGVLAAALILIVPRASDSRAAQARDAALSERVADERSASVAAAAALTSTQTQVSALTQHVQALRGAAKRRATEITALKAQAKKLRAEKARLVAPPAGSGIKVGGPIHTPVFCGEFPPGHQPPGCIRGERSWRSPAPRSSRSSLTVVLVLQVPAASSLDRRSAAGRRSPPRARGAVRSDVGVPAGRCRGVAAGDGHDHTRETAHPSGQTRGTDGRRPEETGRVPSRRM